ncbi:MAG: antibiotic biosynthesis monooxygenase [Bacteroidota bacterium]
MPKYGLHGKLQAVPGKGRQLADILMKASKLVSNAKGCHLYLVSMDTQDPDAVWITEVWDAEEDHDQSLTMPGVRELIGHAMPILAGKPERGQVLDVLGGAGIPIS